MKLRFGALYIILFLCSIQLVLLLHGVEPLGQDDSVSIPAATFVISQSAFDDIPLCFSEKLLNETQQQVEEAKSNWNDTTSTLGPAVCPLTTEVYLSQANVSFSIYLDSVSIVIEEYGFAVNFSAQFIVVTPFSLALTPICIPVDISSCDGVATLEITADTYTNIHFNSSDGTIQINATSNVDFSNVVVTKTMDCETFFEQFDNIPLFGQTINNDIDNLLTQIVSTTIQPILENQVDQALQNRSNEIGVSTSIPNTLEIWKDTLYVNYTVNSFLFYSEQYVVLNASLTFIATDVNSQNQTYSLPANLRNSVNLPPLSNTIGNAALRINSNLVLNVIPWVANITGATRIDQSAVFLDANLQLNYSSAIPVILIQDQDQQLNASISYADATVTCCSTGMESANGTLLSVSVDNVSGSGNIIIANQTSMILNLTGVDFAESTFQLNKPSFPVPQTVVQGLLEQALPSILDVFNLWAQNHPIQPPSAILECVPNPSFSIQGSGNISYFEIMSSPETSSTYLIPPTHQNPKPNSVKLAGATENANFTVVLFNNEDCAFDSGNRVDVGVIISDNLCHPIGAFYQGDSYQVQPQYWGTTNNEDSLPMICSNSNCTSCTTPVTSFNERCSLLHNSLLGVVFTTSEWSIPLLSSVNSTDVLLIVSEKPLSNGSISLPASIANFGASGACLQDPIYNFSLAYNNGIMSSVSFSCNSNCSSCAFNISGPLNQLITMNGAYAEFTNSSSSIIDFDIYSTPSQKWKDIGVSVGLVAIFFFFNALFWFAMRQRNQEMIKEKDFYQPIDVEDNFWKAITWRCFIKGFDAESGISTILSIVFFTLLIVFNPIEESALNGMTNYFNNIGIDMTGMGNFFRYWKICNAVVAALWFAIDLVCKIMAGFLRFHPSYAPSFSYLTKQVFYRQSVVYMGLLLVIVLAPAYMLGAAGVIHLKDISDDQDLKEFLHQVNTALKVIFGGFFTGSVADILLCVLLPIPIPVIYETYRLFFYNTDSGHYKQQPMHKHFKARLIWILVLIFPGIVAPLPTMMYLYQQFSSGGVWLAFNFLGSIMVIGSYVLVCMAYHHNIRHKAILFFNLIIPFIYIVPLIIQSQSDSSAAYSYFRASIFFLSFWLMATIARDDSDLRENEETEPLLGNDYDHEIEYNDKPPEKSIKALAKRVWNFITDDSRPIYFRPSLYVGLTLFVVVLFNYILPESRVPCMEIVKEALENTSGANFTWPVSNATSITPVCELIDRAREVSLYPMYIGLVFLTAAIVSDLAHTKNRNWLRILSYVCSGLLGFSFVVSSIIFPFYNYVGAFPLETVIPDCAPQFSKTMDNIIKNIVGQILAVMLQAKYLLVYCFMPTWLYRGIVHLGAREVKKTFLHKSALFSFLIVPILSAFPLLVVQQLFGDWYSLLIQLAWYFISPFLVFLSFYGDRWKNTSVYLFIMFFGYIAMFIGLVVYISVLNNFGSFILKTLKTPSFYLELVAELSLSLLVVGVILFVVYN